MSPTGRLLQRPTATITDDDGCDGSGRRGQSKGTRTDERIHGWMLEARRDAGMRRQLSMGKEETEP